jgi:hypothetical protein
VLYGACISIATALYHWGEGRVPFFQALGALLGIVAFSILFNVVTWYRRDELSAAAFLMAIAPTAGFLLGVQVMLLLGPPPTGSAALMGLGVFFAVPIRIVVLALVFAVLVGVGRRFRRIFAPDTLRDRDDPIGRSSAAYQRCLTSASS